MTGLPVRPVVATERNTCRHQVELERFEYVPADEGWALLRLLAVAPSGPFGAVTGRRECGGHHPPGGASAADGPAPHDPVGLGVAIDRARFAMAWRVRGQARGRTPPRRLLRAAARGASADVAADSRSWGGSLTFPPQTWPDWKDRPAARRELPGVAGRDVPAGGRERNWLQLCLAALFRAGHGERNQASTHRGHDNDDPHDNYDAHHTNDPDDNYHTSDAHGNYDSDHTRDAHNRYHTDVTGESRERHEAQEAHQAAGVRQSDHSSDAGERHSSHGVVHSVGRRTRREPPAPQGMDGRRPETGQGPVPTSIYSAPRPGVGTPRFTPAIALRGITTGAPSRLTLAARSTDMLSRRPHPSRAVLRRRALSAGQHLPRPRPTWRYWLRSTTCIRRG